MTDVLIKSSKSATPVRLVSEADVERLSGREKAIAATQQFRGKAGQVLIVPDESGGAERQVCYLARALSSRGVDVHVALLRGGAERRPTQRVWLPAGSRGARTQSMRR